MYMAYNKHKILILKAKLMYSKGAFDWEIRFRILKSGFRISQKNAKSKNGFPITEILLREECKSEIRI